jgi:surface protein
MRNIKGDYYHPLISSESIHLSYLSYDTPVSGGYLMGATNQVIASGGEIFDISGSRVHVFTASGDFTVTQGGTVQALIVGGGGAGGRYQGGGGGAGGVVLTSSLFNPSTYTITVGSGGLATNDRGSNGATSSFANFIALGGGGGGVGGNGGWAAAALSTGSNGGSGGGGGGRGGFGGSYVYPGGTGFTGQGNSGAPGSETYSGGGGGAGTAGFTGSNPGGSGGSGSFYPQYAGTGYGFPAGWFGGGGGGGASTFGVTSLPGPGGIGGGGSGSQDQNSVAQSGRSNTGGGGGAGFYGSLRPFAGDGGSGIVIIAYPINTGSSTIFTTPTFISASANDTAGTGLTTGGPLGMITVSRTGSTSMALWKNRVPTKSTTRASASINLDFYLNALNSNNSPISSSQNNVSYASVGAGLTDDEVYTYYELVDNLQTGLGRGVSNPDTFITVWDTTKAGSASDTIVLPLTTSTGLNFTVDWGDGNIETITNHTQATHQYTTPGVYVVKITGDILGWSFNNGGDKLKLMDIGQWGSFNISTSAGFYGCTNMTCTATDAPLITSTSLQSYFFDCINFNGAIGNWDVSSVINLRSMFLNASQFNQPIGNWYTSNVTDMSLMFRDASSFNQDISTKVVNSGLPNEYVAWDTSNVIFMGQMFIRAALFNGDIGNWDVSSCTIMDFTFSNATAFNQDIGGWNVSNVTNFSNFMAGKTAANYSADNLSSIYNGWSSLPSVRPNLSINFGSILYNPTAQAGKDILDNAPNNWTIVDGGVLRTETFEFSVKTDNAGTSTSTQFRMPLVSSTGLYFNVDWGDGSPIETITNHTLAIHTYATAGTYTISTVGNIQSWQFAGGGDRLKMLNVSQWSGFNITLGNAFQGCTNLTANATDAPLITGTSISSTFRDCTNFNGAIGNWDVSRCTVIARVFTNATAFNQDIGAWDVSSATNMIELFNNATAFNQDIGNWNVSNVTNFTNFMGGKTSVNYSATNLASIYNGWSSRTVKPNLTINFNTIDYSASAAEGKALLERTSFSASIIDIQDNGGNFQISGSSVAEGLSSGNKITISGTGNPVLDKAHAILDILDVNTFTVNVPFTASAAQGEVITGYGWNITDGDPV